MNLPTWQEQVAAEAEAAAGPPKVKPVPQPEEVSSMAGPRRRREKPLEEQPPTVLLAKQVRLTRGLYVLAIWAFTLWIVGGLIGCVNDMVAQQELRSTIRSIDY